MKRRRRPLDWLATALFVGVAAAALASFSGAAAADPPAGWYCPNEFDYDSRLTGTGWDLRYGSRACEEAAADLKEECKANGGDRDCCRTAGCDLSCALEGHLNCWATEDGWPHVFHVIIDGGDGGDDGGSGSGSGN